MSRHKKLKDKDRLYRKAYEVAPPEITPERMKEIRLGLRLSQAQMAKEVGVTREMYNRYELGKVRISKPVKMLVELME